MNSSKPAPRLRAALAMLAVLAVGCGGTSPDSDREALYRTSVALKADSAATRAFFETVLADSIQRERLAQAILENEGMRQTMTQALLRDSLDRVPGSGLPSSQHLPDTSGAPALRESLPAPPP